MDYRLLASPRLARIQEALDALAGIFYQVRLRINFNKMVGMLCQACCTISIK